MQRQDLNILLLPVSCDASAGTAEGLRHQSCHCDLLGSPCDVSLAPYWPAHRHECFSPSFRLLFSSSSSVSLVPALRGVCELAIAYFLPPLHQYDQRRCFCCKDRDPKLNIASASSSQIEHWQRKRNCFFFPRAQFFPLLDPVAPVHHDKLPSCILAEAYCHVMILLCRLADHEDHSLHTPTR